MLKLKGKSALEEVAVVKKDMPNFYVEAVTVSGGQVVTPRSGKPNEALATPAPER